MAIVKMRKFALMFPEENKPRMLAELQRFEQVHLHTLEPSDDEVVDFLKRDGPGDDEAGLENDMARVRFALSKLSPHEVRPTGLKALREAAPSIAYDDFIAFSESFDHKGICDRVKAEDDKITASRQEKLRLSTFMEELKIWWRLDTSTAELDRLRTVDYLFGLVNRASLDVLVTTLEAEFPTVYTEAVGQIKEDIILLILAPKDGFDVLLERLRALGFSRTAPGFDGVPEELMAQCKALRADAQKAETEAVEAIKSLAVHCGDLRILLDHYETRAARAEASRNFLRSRTVIVCEGWMPADESDAFVKILEDVCAGQCYYELEDVPQDSEDVPIKLKNGKLLAPFESIVEMYALPKYGELDPTMVVAPFYTLFFGLMVGDMAYGLILVVATLLALKLFNLKEGTRKFLSFFTILGFGTMFGGMLYGGFFGYTVFTPIPLPGGGSKAILDTSLDIVPMLLGSVVLGVFHILFGLGVKGYMLVRDGKPLDALFDSGFWIITLIGGIGYLLDLSGMMPAPYGSICGWMFGLGALGLALTQGRTSPSFGGKAANGLYAVYGLSSYVGDFVSYTRIAALALSGAYIAFSFNLMVDMFSGVWKIVAGGLVFLIGQSLNFGLAALGAYVHTCRLTYVEYFGKFYGGGGTPYRPLRLINNFVKVDK